MKFTAVRVTGISALLFLLAGIPPEESPKREGSPTSEADAAASEESKPNAITGVVHSPDGKPVAQTKVYLATAKSPAWIANGERLVTRPRGVFTDAEGSFRFSPSVDGDFTLLVLDSQGYAVVRKAELRADGVLALRPWAVVEGEVRIGSKVAKGESVHLTALRPSLRHEPQVSWIFGSESDESGRFRFARVPEESFSVGRTIRQTTGRAPLSHNVAWTTVTPKAGETIDVTIGGAGRPIIGRLAAPAESVTPLDWKYGRYMLIRISPDPSEKDVASSNAAAPVVGPGLSVFEVQPNGEFRADDLMPGRYQLSATITETPQEAQGRFPETIAIVGKEFTIGPIPGGQTDEPLDLGEILATPIKRVRIGDQAPEFTVTGLDGKPVSLGDYRGKFVYLEFWATWCGPCMAEVPNLKVAYERFRDDDRLVMIGMILDEKAEVARETVRKQEILWRMGHPGDSGNSVVDDYGIRAIPASFLIDPDGKVIAKDLSGKALADTLERHLAKAATANNDQ